jgi:hypothetical protein
MSCGSLWKHQAMSEQKLLIVAVQASQAEMFKMYSEVKGYICCSVPDMLAPMWTGLTMAGVSYSHVLVQKDMNPN